MLRRLPPLASLAAFEAAARHVGFLAAANEMNLTPGAIAHHVRQLEAWLGVSLFQRLPRGVALTAAGARYAQNIGALLDDIAVVSERVRRQADDKVVTVTATPSFVTRWLMPRLENLRLRQPGIDLRVLASSHAVDFTREGVDVAIRLGKGNYPGNEVVRLMPEEFWAVCSPHFLDTHPNLRTPEDLENLVLLHDEADPGIPLEIDWTRWLATFGIKYPIMKGPRFSHTYLTLEAAASGQGVAIAAGVLMQQDLEHGRLIRLFDLSVTGPYTYFLVRPSDTQTRPAVNAFCEWVACEAGVSKFPK